MTKQLFRSKTTNLISSASLHYEIIPQLEIKTDLGFSSMWVDEYSQIGPREYYRPEQRATAVRQATYGDNKVSSWTIEPQASYSRQIGKK